jgi:hypothetical protein
MMPSMSQRPGPNYDESDEAIEERVRAAKELRVQLTTGKRDLVRQIAELLFANDPMGINFGSNVDEYTAEAESIVIELPGASDVHDIATLIHRVFVQWFSPEDAGPQERYEAVAGDVWETWVRHRGTERERRELERETSTLGDRRRLFEWFLNRHSQTACSSSPKLLSVTYVHSSSTTSSPRARETA